MVEEAQVVEEKAKEVEETEAAVRAPAARATVAAVAVG